LLKKYKLKKVFLSRSLMDAQEGTYLNRRIRFVNDGIEIEGDPKHAKLLIDEWGMLNAKGVDTPLNKEVCKMSTGRNPMTATEATRFRRGVARINYMSQDRCDLSSASKIMSQSMSNPLRGDDAKLKRVVRYLVINPRCINLMKYQTVVGGLPVMVDSDWAGDEKTRKSTSGGIVLHGGHLISHLSKAQTSIALSSGEAELNALFKGMTAGIGAFELLAEFCVEPFLELCTDSSAANGIILRSWVGRLKHLSTKQLWVQGAVAASKARTTKQIRDIISADI
jgi:hypothetical protein